MRFTSYKDKLGYLLSKDDCIKAIVTHFGTARQTNKAIEELSEAVTELSRAMDGLLTGEMPETVKNRDQIAEEIADAKIMLAQIEAGYKLTDEVEDWVCRKLIRTMKIVEGITGER